MIFQVRRSRHGGNWQKIFGLAEWIGLSGKMQRYLRYSTRIFSRGYSEFYWEWKRRRREHSLKGLEVAIWEEISRHFERIRGCCLDKDQSAFWSVRGYCLKWSDEGFFRALEATVWNEISRHFEGIRAYYLNKDQSAFSKCEKLLFETIRRKSFESVRGVVWRG